MLTAGLYYNLRVNRVSDFGLYLADEDGEEVLLPNRFVSIDNKVDDVIHVFVYHDSEDRLVATTDTPLATAGEVAFLRVVDKTIHGAFLDWGLKAKDLFLPNRNQKGRVDVNSSYVVYLYSDNVTGRVVASMNFNSFINNNEISVHPREEVQIMVALESPIGYRVVINNRNWGMIYRNQLFRPVNIGDTFTAYITRITEDNRIDVTIQQLGYDHIKTSADELLELIRKAGGVLPLCDSSNPEEVHRITGLSKKSFKRTMGYLMKQGLVSMDDKQTTLTNP